MRKHKILRMLYFNYFLKFFKLLRCFKKYNNVEFAHCPGVKNVRILGNFISTGKIKEVVVLSR